MRVVVEIAVAATLTVGALAWVSGSFTQYLDGRASRPGANESACTYSVIPLEWGAMGRVLDLSDVNVAAGVTCGEDRRIVPVLWRDGETTLCRAVGDGSYGAAVAVTEAGWVAFNIESLSKSGCLAYVSTPDGGVVCLNDAPGSTAVCRVRDVNSSGSAVGTLVYGDALGRAFVWSAAAGMVTLDGPGSSAIAISDAGTVVGFGRGQLAREVPRQWSPQPDGSYRAVDLCRQNPSDGRAHAVNGPGLVVGRVFGAVPLEWDVTRGEQLLPVLRGGKFGGALAVNDRGDIVGCSSSADGGRAVLWNQGGVVDLNACIDQSGGWHLVEATAINNQGVIACTALRNEVSEAVLLIPHWSVDEAPRIASRRGPAA